MDLEIENKAKNEAQYLFEIYFDKKWYNEKHKMASMSKQIAIECAITCIDYAILKNPNDLEYYNIVKENLVKILCSKKNIV